MNAASSHEKNETTVLWFGLAAAFGSVLFHFMLLIWFYGYRLSFDKPAIDPVDPPRFHLKRSEIDPKRLESEKIPTPIVGKKNSRDILPIKPEDIAAFEGVLEAPRIPTPRLISDAAPSSLSAGAVPVPIEAFSALDLYKEGNIPQVSQALVDEASTAALAETQESLAQGNLTAGRNSDRPIGGVPGFKQISKLVQLKPPEALQRPAFQPILLRLSSDLLFNFDSAELRPEGEETLREVVIVLKTAQKAKITIEGHTDTIGGDEYNLDLSRRRAQAVADWLLLHATVTQEALTVRGFGETHPIANPQGNADAQAVNRRVEIRLEGER